MHTEMETYLLGLKFLGHSDYNPGHPTISYFTIGQLISVIALVLTFSQLSSPIIKFRAKAWNIKVKTYAVLALIAILSVFIANILPFIPGTAVPIIGYPIFWELTAAIVLIVCALRLIYMLNRTPAFNKKNARGYLNACTRLIANGHPDVLFLLAEEIASSIEPIFRECIKYNPFEARIAKEQNKEYKISDTTRCAYTILDLWSDKTFELT